MDDQQGLSPGDHDRPSPGAHDRSSPGEHDRLSPGAHDRPSPGDRTLATYERAAGLYDEQRGPVGGPVAVLLDELVARVPGGHVLEVGCGPGLDADYLEARGLYVDRTDATAAFVELNRSRGHQSRLLDLRRDELTPPGGGEYDAVLADAVLLHLTRQELAAALGRALVGVRPGGLLACTLKEGDGEGWSDHRLGSPRHFTYWREPALRAVLEEQGWEVLSLTHEAGERDDWLMVLARRPAGRHEDGAP